jgi:hypothetical protein
MVRLTTPRRSVQFERRPSQRFSRRTTYATKRQKQQEQKLQTNTNKSNEATENLININDGMSAETPMAPKKIVPPQPMPRISRQLNNQNAVVPSISETKLNQTVFDSI